MLATRAADASLRPRLRQPGRRPGRAGLRRRLDGVRRRRRAAGPAAAVREERVAGRRRRGRSPCSASGCSTPGAGPSTTPLPVVEVVARRPRRPGPPTRRPGRRSPSRCTPIDEVYEALVLGTRDYVAQERLHRRRDRAVGRHRLVARGRHRRRRPRRRARARRVHAVALLARPLARPTPRSWPPTWASTTAPSPSSRPTPPSSRCWRRASRAASPTSPRRTSSAASGACSLMALSNKFGWMVLTTGNKSEMAVGYSTLYGDTAGGFAVIKDVPKTAGLRAVPRPQRAGRARRSSPRPCSPSRRRPSCGPTSATTSPCRPTRCSTRSSRPTSRTTAPRPSSSTPGFDPELVRRIMPPGRPRRVQAPPVAPRACGSRPRPSARTAASPSPTRYRGLSRPGGTSDVSEPARPGGRTRPQAPPPPAPRPGAAAGPTWRWSWRPSSSGPPSSWSRTPSRVPAPVGFLAARFLLGGAVLAVVARRRPGGAARATPRRRGRARPPVGYICQTVGLQYTTAATSAFLTYLLVVVVPLAGWVALGRRPHPLTAVGVALAVAGLRPAHRRAAAPGIGRGEVLTLGCAVAFAVHIVILGEVASRHDAVRLTCIQLATVGRRCLSRRGHRRAWRCRPRRRRRPPCSPACSPRPWPSWPWWRPSGS